MSARRLRIAVLGTGALGTALARALAANGADVCVWNRAAARVPSDLARARRATLAALFDRRAPLDALVLAVSDAAIEPVARACALAFEDVAFAEVAFEQATSEERAASGSSASATNPPATAVLHTSGCTPVEALAALGARGAAVGFVHPLTAVPTEVSRDVSADSVARFRGVPFGVGGDEAACASARALVELLGGRSLDVRPGAQARYHAAAALAAGGTVALAEAARALMADALATGGSDGVGAGAEDGCDPALEAVRHLVASAAANLARHAPAGALTGPFARGDGATLEAHLAALASGDDAAVRARALSMALAPLLVDLARARGAPPLDPDLLARLLGGEPQS